jgi:hypothetical protein
MPVVFAAAAARFGFVEVCHATTPTRSLADGIVRTVFDCAANKASLR